MLFSVGWIRVGKQPYSLHPGFSAGSDPSGLWWSWPTWERWKRSVLPAVIASRFARANSHAASRIDPPCSDGHFTGATRGEVPNSSPASQPNAVSLATVFRPAAAGRTPATSVTGPIGGGSRLRVKYIATSEIQAAYSRRRVEERTEY